MDVYEEMDRLRTLYAALSDRVTALEQRKTRRGSGNVKWEPDEVSTAVLELLRSAPGIKFNSGAIAVNIGHDVHKVAARMETLVRRKLVLSESRSKAYKTFWVPFTPDIEVNQ